MGLGREVGGLGGFGQGLYEGRTAFPGGEGFRTPGLFGAPHSGCQGACCCVRIGLEARQSLFRTIWI